MSSAGVIPSAQSHLWQPHLRLLQMAVVHSSERDYDGIMKCHGQNGRNSTQNVTIIIIIIITNPKPVYVQQGLAGGILGPGYSSSGYILGCSQHLALRLQRSAQIGCKTQKFKFSKFLKLKKDFKNPLN